MREEGRWGLESRAAGNGKISFGRGEGDERADLTRLVDLSKSKREE